MNAYISAVPSVIDQIDHHNMVVRIIVAIYFFKVRWVGVALTEPAQDENKDDTVYNSFTLQQQQQRIT